VSEIRTWLDGIGLAQYASAFETNDIDIGLLGQVTVMFSDLVGSTALIAAAT
jgi:hypothetical protein